jgi:hypothetical protein
MALLPAAVLGRRFAAPIVRGQIARALAHGVPAAVPLANGVTESPTSRVLRAGCSARACRVQRQLAAVRASDVALFMPCPAAMRS